MRQILPYGKYLLLERISVGGMAEVFTARTAAEGTASGKIIAIKRILPSMAADADFIQMFIDEARISGQLSHPHIAQIYELGRVDESHFIAMEFVWGKDVLQIQNRFRRLKQVMPFPMAAFVAMKLAEALDYAHRKKGADGKSLGIIHRDVSPQNVLVSYQGEVKVIDFGIAKAASRSTKTQAGVLKGKYGYMSPEQVSGQVLDHRSDIFAIGTILYELITADRLFVAESDFATLERVRKVDVQRPAEAVAGCPPEIDAIILRALAKDPAERYQWASEMQADLQAWLTSLSTPFTAREMATWMQEQFAAEMKREGQTLDENLEAAEELQRTPAGLGPRASQSLSLPPAACQPETPRGDLSSEATQITNASFGALLAAHASRAQAVPAGGGLELASESTRIFSAHDVGPRRPPEPTDMPNQATAIFDSSSMQPPPGAVQPPPLQPSYPPPHMPTGAYGSGQLAPHPRTGQLDTLPYAAPPKSTLARDVVLGLLLATVLVGGALSARVYMAKSRLGTLVVGVVAPRTAIVTVDDQERGRVASGEALTVRDMATGTHRVRVTADGAPALDKQVTIAASDVAVIMAVLAAPANDEQRATATAQPPGRQPAGNTEPKQAEAASGDQAPDQPPAKPAEKTADAIAKVEQPTKPVADGRGHLSVLTDPPGADVLVNGKNVGVSPLELSDLDPKRSARVSIKKKGYTSVTKRVDFKSQLDRVLDVKLAGGGPSDKGDKAAATGKPGGEPGFLVANTQPWAKVLIDGKDTGKSTPIAPRSKIALKPGKHVVTFVSNGKKFDFDVEIKPGEDFKLIKTLGD